ncbi:Paladin [Salix suchowensis]|nr:Paladin [Salix suchowensis]
MAGSPDGDLEVGTGAVASPGRRNDVAIAGGQILGDEYSDHVVKHTPQVGPWLSESHYVEHGVRGAINFRQVPNTKIYALGQPTLEAIDEVVSRVKEAHPSAHRIVWITLREEPIVYVNGAPYCLRREGFSLRNMKDYSFTPKPQMGRCPRMGDAGPDDVAVLKEVMAGNKTFGSGVELVYRRIPITAERAPDFADLTELIELVVNESADTLSS